MRRTLEIGLLQTFVLLVEERNVTRVARRLHRSQPAVSLQLRRLEEAAAKPLFEPDLRHMRLTSAGERLLPYARAMLQMHDEAQQDLAIQVAGRVTLGCPDLYAAFLLPRTLASFRASYPGVEVTVRCALSRQLAVEVSEGIVDVALATRMPDVNPILAGITSLRKERLVWLGAVAGEVYKSDPLPIGMLPENNLYRDYAIAALNRCHRAWRIACVSESIAGLQAMALADASVIVLAETVDVPGLRRLGSKDGLPSLPPVELVLWRGRHGVSPAADHLANHIIANLTA